MAKKRLPQAPLFEGTIPNEAVFHMVDTTDLSEHESGKSFKVEYEKISTQIISEIIFPEPETPVSTFTELTDTPANYTGSGKKILSITEGEDGVEFIENGKRNQIISGGQYTQTDNIYFDINPVKYIIDNTTYTIDTNSQFTLSNGDAVADRFDVIVVDTDNDMVLIEGTPSGTPALPALTADQLVLMIIYVPQLADEFSVGVTDITITYWAGYEPNSLNQNVPLKYYKENYVDKQEAYATGKNSLAIGQYAIATHEGSQVIGRFVSSKATNEIQIKNTNIILDALRTFIANKKLIFLSSTQQNPASESSPGNSSYAGAFGLTRDKIIKLNLEINPDHDFEIFTDTTTSNGYIGVRGNLQFLHALEGLIYEYSTTDPEAVGSGINIFNNKVRINETLRLNEGFIVPNTTDSCSGVAKLTNGQVIVPHNQVEANSKIFVSYRAISGTIGVHLVALSVDVSPPTQFIIKSLNSSGSVETGDQSDVSYFIIRQG